MPVKGMLDCSSTQIATSVMTAAVPLRPRKARTSAVAVAAIVIDWLRIANGRVRGPKRTRSKRVTSE